MGMAMAACTTDEPNPAPQANGPVPEFDATAVKVEADPALTSTIDLTALNNDGKQAPVAIVKDAGSLPEGYNLYFTAQASTADDFSDAMVLTCVYDSASNTVSIAPDNLNAFVRTKTKDIVPFSFNLRLAPHAVLNDDPNSAVRLMGRDFYYGTYAMTVKPFEPAHVIEDSYYLLLSDDGRTWDFSKAIKAIHSDTNVYDDPNFSIMFYVTDDEAQNGKYWIVVPQSTYAAAKTDGMTVFGVSQNEQTESKGTLTEGGEAGVVYQAGTMQMSINMETRSFEYIPAIEQFYTPGGANDWSAANSTVLYTSDYKNYQGYIRGDVKFKINPDLTWAKRDFGVGDGGIKSEVKDGIYTLTFNADGGNDIEVPVNATYWMTLNYEKDTRPVTMISIKTYGLIGDATTGGWDKSTALTSDDNGLTWTGTVDLKGSGNFKFRANDGWDVNLGGALNNLVPGGGDIATPGEGKYKVTLNLGVYPYSATLEKL